MAIRLVGLASDVARHALVEWCSGACTGKNGYWLKLHSRVGWLVAVRQLPGWSAALAGNCLAAERGCLRVGAVKSCRLRWVDVITESLGWSLITDWPLGWSCALLYQSWWAEPRLVVAAVSADWSAKGAESDWLSSAV
jgi:hypothetical protein